MHKYILANQNTSLVTLYFATLNVTNSKLV